MSMRRNGLRFPEQELSHRREGSFAEPKAPNIPDMILMPRILFARARLGLAVLAAFLAVVVFSPLAAAAPEVDLWPRWEAHDPASRITVDHAVWDRLLRTHVRAHADGVSRFDYAGLQATDRAALDGYVAALSATPVSTLNRNEQFAYWINFYNALTIQVVVGHYPVDSIRDIDISPGLFASGPWGKKLVAVEGETLSLDDIEHRILRPIWRDPRIHYGVNCASIGCPNLIATAYTAENMDSLLTENARAYVNHPRGAVVEDGALTVSKIYSWFDEDFGGNEAGVIAHLRDYAGPELLARLRDIDDVADYEYDWALNDGSPTGS